MLSVRVSAASAVEKKTTRIRGPDAATRPCRNGSERILHNTTLCHDDVAAVSHAPARATAAHGSHLSCDVSCMTYTVFAWNVLYIKTDVTQVGTMTRRRWIIGRSVVVVHATCARSRPTGFFLTRAESGGQLNDE